MFVKIMAIFLIIDLNNAQFLDWDPYPEKYKNPPPGDEFVDNCNKSLCALPCEDTAPPPFCPPLPSNCNTGCAGMNICGTHAILLFEIEHCLKRKRMFTRRRKITTESTTTTATRRLVRHY